jgi:hypothetical protein
MAAANFRVILRYENTASHLGWTVSTVVEAADAVAAQALADPWNTKYLACCPPSTFIKDCRVSDVGLWSDMRIFSPAGFAHAIGTNAGTYLVPIAECILLTGSNDNPFVLQRSRWHLHGISTALILDSGELDQSDTSLIALLVASFDYLMAYRKADTPVHHLPKNDPPVTFASFSAEGPFVRRVGNPFFLAGQRARYTRA